MVSSESLKKFEILDDHLSIIKKETRSKKRLGDPVHSKVVVYIFCLMYPECENLHCRMDIRTVSKVTMEKVFKGGHT